MPQPSYAKCLVMVFINIFPAEVSGSPQIRDYSQFSRPSATFKYAGNVGLTSRVTPAPTKTGHLYPRFKPLHGLPYPFGLRCMCPVPRWNTCLPTWTPRKTCSPTGMSPFKASTRSSSFAQLARKYPVWSTSASQGELRSIDCNGHFETDYQKYNYTESHGAQVQYD